MATRTECFGLKKPEGEDFYDIEDFNENADILDAELKKANDRLDCSQEVKRVTLTAGNWSTVAPYTQSVPVAGITATDAPIIGLRLVDGTTAVNVKAQSKAWGCVDRAVTGDGTITFYCYNKKPAVDFTVSVKGV